MTSGGNHNPQGRNQVTGPNSKSQNVYLPSINDNPTPPLPKAAWYLGNGREWSVRATELWERLWRSPQSTQWLDVHHDILGRYLLLHERMWLESDVTGPMLTAIKALETELGLTPRAMRNLNWYVGEAPEVSPVLASVKPIGKVAAQGRGRRDIQY